MSCVCVYVHVHACHQVSYRPRRKRVAVLVSKMDHCLFDLLIRQRSGELPCDIPVVISNHPDLQHVAGMFDVDFEHLGFKRDLDKAVAKQQQEAAIERVGGAARHRLLMLPLERRRVLGCYVDAAELADNSDRRANCQRTWALGWGIAPLRHLGMVGRWHVADFRGTGAGS